MKKVLEFGTRWGFLLLLAAVLIGGEAWMRVTDPVGHMTCIPRSDYEIIRGQYPDMTFEKAIFGSSAVTASYIAGQNDTGYVNLGVDYGTVKDITEMLEKGLVTVTDELVLGLNNLSFLDSLPTNETYPWHREWYQPYLYFQRDRLYALITEGVDSVLHGGPFILRDTSVQQRVVYRGRYPTRPSPRAGTAWWSGSGTRARRTVRKTWPPWTGWRHTAAPTASACGRCGCPGTASWRFTPPPGR